MKNLSVIEGLIIVLIFFAAYATGKAIYLAIQIMGGQ